MRLPLKIREKEPCKIEKRICRDQQGAELCSRNFYLWYLRNSFCLHCSACERRVHSPVAAGTRHALLDFQVLCHARPISNLRDRPGVEKPGATQTARRTLGESPHRLSLTQLKPTQICLPSQSNPTNPNWGKATGTHIFALRMCAKRL